MTACSLRIAPAIPNQTLRFPKQPKELRTPQRSPRHSAASLAVHIVRQRLQGARRKFRLAPSCIVCTPAPSQPETPRTLQPSAASTSHATDLSHELSKIYLVKVNPCETPKQQSFGVRFVGSPDAPIAWSATSCPDPSRLLAQQSSKFKYLRAVGSQAKRKVT